MTGTPRSRSFSFILLFGAITLLLTIVWAIPIAAQVPPGPPPADDTPTPHPGSGPPAGGLATATPRPTARPTARPTSAPGGNGSSQPPTTPINTPSTGTGGKIPTLDEALAEYELIKALAPNRIIFHSATPIQLCKAENGLQIYFISSKGKTRLGPWIPSFAELAAKHPEGTEASIYLGYNPFTGKKVKIDYLPHVNRIRVDTFYADRDKDKNKQYIFHFGPEHDITYDAW